jgi:hypothetical protein
MADGTDSGQAKSQPFHSMAEDQECSEGMFYQFKARKDTSIHRVSDDHCIYNWAIE